MKKIPKQKKLLATDLHRLTQIPTMNRPGGTISVRLHGDSSFSLFVALTKPVVFRMKLQYSKLKRLCSSVKTCGLK